MQCSIEIKYKPDFEPTNDTPYFTIPGEVKEVLPLWIFWKIVSLIEHLKPLMQL